MVVPQPSPATVQVPRSAALAACVATHSDESGTRQYAPPAFAIPTRAISQVVLTESSSRDRRRIGVVTTDFQFR